MSELIYFDHRSLMQFSFLIMLSVTCIVAGYIVTGHRSRNIVFLNLGNLVYTLFFFTVSLDIAMPLRKLPEVVALLDLTAVILWIVSLKQTIHEKSPIKIYLVISILHVCGISVLYNIFGTVSILRTVTSLVVVEILLMNILKIRDNNDFVKLESYMFTVFTLVAYAVFKFAMGFYRLFSHNYEVSVLSIETSINVFTFLSVVFAIWLNFTIMFLHYDVKRSEVERLSKYDALTHLPNRKLLFEQFETRKHLASKGEQNFSVALLDIDDFKGINDTYGHNIGDEVLRDFSTEMSKRMRYTDFISRYGGDEFMIILSTYDYNELELALERIMEAVYEVTLSSLDLSITVSVGAIFVNHEFADEDLSSLSAVADKNLYEAKRIGKNQYVSSEYKK